MFRLIKNNKNSNNVDVIEEFENFGDLFNYLFTTDNFKMYHWNYLSYIKYIHENYEQTEVVGMFNFYNVPNSSKMADLFKAGKVAIYEAYNNDNGESKIIVTDDLIIPDVNDLLAVYGETTTPTGVKNIFEVIE